jgi:glycosyltransferase involved in cell wall biosynthesis
MIGVVVPAHNEEDHLGACLASLRRSGSSPQLQGEAVMIVVALDSCTDRSESIARKCDAKVVSVHGHNAGVARAAGAELALQSGARWLAFTDADSVVAQNWLCSQLALQTDAVCGTVDHGRQQRQVIVLDENDRVGLTRLGNHRVGKSLVKPALRCVVQSDGTAGEVGCVPVDRQGRNTGGCPVPPGNGGVLAGGIDLARPYRYFQLGPVACAVNHLAHDACLSVGHFSAAYFAPCAFTADSASSLISSSLR